MGLDKLTKQQVEIISYLSKGLLAKEISFIMNLSYRTIQAYICDILRNFDCKNTTHLVAMCLRNKIIK